MNTKAAVILMIGLLGMPAVFNFTTPPASPGPRWTVVPVGSGPSENYPTPRALIVDNRTGETSMIHDSLVGGEGKKVFSPQNILMSNSVSPGR